MPPHILRLKVGMPVMLLRNLDPGSGHCNGSRYYVVAITPHLLEVRASPNSPSFFIPRVTLTPSDATLPFQLCRRQFPVRLAFAMTINKSQGQTYRYAGVYLPEPVFTHGQLYVATSRVGSAADIKFCIAPNALALHYYPERAYRITRNVAYTEVLQ